MKNALINGLSGALAAIAVNKDGGVRPIGKWLLFDGCELRRSLRRIFFKKDGTVRKNLPSRLHSPLEAIRLMRWIRDYDTPSADFISHIETTKDEVGNTIILVSLNNRSSNLSDFTSTIKDIAGLNFDVCITPKTNHLARMAEELAKQLRQAGVLVVSYANLDFLRYDSVVWLDTMVRVRPHGPRFFIDTLSKNKECLLVYGDEYFLDLETYRADAWLKPQYSPLFATQRDILGGMIAFGTDCISLRNLEKILREDPAKIPGWVAQALPEKAITRLPNFCYDRCQPIETEFNELIPEKSQTDNRECKVSIIIPTRNGWSLLEPCLRSVLKSDWPQGLLEVIVVDNGSDEPDFLNGVERFKEKYGITVVRDDSPFNFAKLNNLAVRKSAGEILLFLNNDTEVIQNTWLRDLVAIASNPDAGAVGAKLLYEDRTVQHAGVVLGIHGGAGHGFVGLPEEEPGHFGTAIATREISAVTGACLAVRRDAFDAAGGFDEDLRVAYNDVALCLRLNELGLRNYIVSKPLLLHYESKSRGLDTTVSKQFANLKEAAYTRRMFNQQMQNDPYYSPNLSTANPYQLADFPRWKSPWRVPGTTKQKHILLLSSTHRIGFGVPVVVERHVRALRRAGFKVTVAGPRSDDDFDYGHADRLMVTTPEEAANWALRNGVDLVWAHTPPYYSTAASLGGLIPVVAYDYGEPPVRLFPDWIARERINLEKEFAFSMCDHVYAISDAVSDEAGFRQDGVIPLGNDHLSRWNDSLVDRRLEARKRLEWEGSKVVLNVCRFSRGEQHYKGIDFYLECMRHSKVTTGLYEDQTRFVLCGRGEPADVRMLEDAGLEVYANLSDEDLIEIYLAADVYANFSHWEGYNLGIGQALALGLPVVAYDIPAHRAFGVETFSDAVAASNRLAEILENPGPRVPKFWSWKKSEEAVVQLTEKISGVCEADQTNRKSDKDPAANG